MDFPTTDARLRFALWALNRPNAFAAATGAGVAVLMAAVSGYAWIAGAHLPMASLSVPACILACGVSAGGAALWMARSEGPWPAEATGPESIRVARAQIRQGTVGPGSAVNALARRLADHAHAHARRSKPGMKRQRSTLLALTMVAASLIWMFYGCAGGAAWIAAIWSLMLSVWLAAAVVPPQSTGDELSIPARFRRAVDSDGAL